MSSISLIEAQRNSIQLLYQFHVYTKSCEFGNVVTWRCRQRSCHGKVKVQGVAVIAEVEHNHLPDKSKVAAMEVTRAIKKRAAETVKQPRQIIQA